MNSHLDRKSLPPTPFTFTDVFAFLYIDFTALMSHPSAMDAKRISSAVPHISANEGELRGKNLTLIRFMVEMKSFSYDCNHFIS